jgi:pimeloyl-ACP methyl ester carboxylesterase
VNDKHPENKRIWVRLRRLPNSSTILLATAAWVGMVLLAADTTAGQSDGPEIEQIELETQDGLSLGVMYYPAAVEESDEKDEKDKDEEDERRMQAVPIIILHHWKGQASDYEPLALYLQAKGHAVVVPDLRGHGESSSSELNVDRFKERDIQSMIHYDMEAVKKFLLRKNDDKQLNIEKLCVIGVEFGALVALNWAVKDWSWPDLLTRKQGKDVKALVLVSPLSTMRDIDTNYALRHPDVRAKLSMLFIVGAEDTRAMRTTKKLHGKLKRYHPDPPADQEKTLRTLYLFDHATNLQGLKLLEQADLQNKLIIEKFIQERLAAKRFPWKKRQSSP